VLHYRKNRPGAAILGYAVLSPSNHECLSKDTAPIPVDEVTEQTCPGFLFRLGMMELRYPLVILLAFQMALFEKVFL